MTVQTGSIQVQIENNIATVTFYHPLSNSMPGELLKELEQTFYQLHDNREVKVIILSSSGERTFCAGASFDELLAIDNPTAGVAFFNAFGKVIKAMISGPKPILGRIQGKAVGGGVGLIAACDYAIAKEAASVKLSEISIGIGPFVVEPAISHKIGVAATAALAFNPTWWKEATWAQNKGLYAEVYPTLAEVDYRVIQLAGQWASYTPDAIQTLKKVIWNDTETLSKTMEDRAQICGHLVLSEATKTALSQFKNK